MDGWKLLCRSEDDLCMWMAGNRCAEVRTIWGNELNIVKAISKDTDMNFGLENCAGICLEKGGPKAKCTGSRSETDSRELDLRKACKY